MGGPGVGNLGLVSSLDRFNTSAVPDWHNNLWFGAGNGTNPGIYVPTLPLRRN